MTRKERDSGDEGAVGGWDVRVDSLRGVEKLVSRLNDYGVCDLGLDFDGTVCFPGIGFPEEALRRLRSAGVNTVLVTGSSPATLGRKLREKGVSGPLSSLFNQVWTNNGAVGIKTYLTPDNLTTGLDSVLALVRETEVEKQVLQNLLEVMPAWLEAGVEWVAFHPLWRDRVGCYGYRLWANDQAVRENLRVEYGGEAQVVESLDSWLGGLIKGATKVTVKLRGRDGWRGLVSELEKNGWLRGGRGVWGLVHPQVNKEQTVNKWMNRFGGDFVRTAYLGNDRGDLGAMQAVSHVLVVNSDPEEATAIKDSLESSFYRWTLALIEPKWVGEWLGVWARRRSGVQVGGGVEGGVGFQGSNEGLGDG